MANTRPIDHRLERGHTAAAILLGGWVLMYPPTMKDPGDRTFGWRAVTDAPITKWDQLEAYDTAAQCEAVKAGEMKFHTDLWGDFSDDRIRREANQTKGTDTAGREIEDALARTAVGYAKPS